MKKKSPRYGSDLARAATIPGVPDDDIPEVTRDQIGKTLIDVTGLFGKSTRKRGRPLGSGKKEPLYILVDRDILAHFRAAGRGWQTRINATLRKAMLRKPVTAKGAKPSRAASSSRALSR
jgi:uncharacterized protein (DUF4415 family)